jgi:hypothetical protein
MSTAILSDGSVVVRLAWQTIHLDVRTRAIHLRAPADDGLGGDIRESFPQAAIDRVKIVRGPEQHHHLMIELKSGRSLSLGHATTHDHAMMTARVVADLTRCKVEVSEGTHALPGASVAFSRGATLSSYALPVIGEDDDPFDEPTHRMMWEADTNEAATLRPPPPSPPTFAKALRTSFVISDGEEDPLDDTICRPASADEAALRVAENSEEDAA